MQLNIERFWWKVYWTQCSQGLWGKPAWEESYTSLLEKAVAPYPPKQNPTIKWHKQVRDPLWSVVVREFRSNCGMRGVLQELSLALRASAGLPVKA